MSNSPQAASTPGGRPSLRIGAFAERAGVTAGTIRAWETRHGFPPSERTDGGHRLYRPDQIERVRMVRMLVDDGWAVAAAIDQVNAAPLPEPSAPSDVVRPPDLSANSQPWTSASRFHQSGPQVAGGVAPSPNTIAVRPATENISTDESETGPTACDVDHAAEAGLQRALIRVLEARSVTAVVDALVWFVVEMGGTVGGAAIEHDGVLPIDISMGRLEPLLPRAEPFSLGRMRLEALLPRLVEQSRSFVAVLRAAGLDPDLPDSAGATR